MSRMKYLWLFALLGCGDANNGGGAKTIDAPPKVVDAPIDAPADAPAPVVIAAAKAHIMYLNTEGVTAHAGSDDATMDKTALIQADLTLAPWLANQADRATQIATVVSDISTKLAAYDITVTTTRPTTGAYHEVVVTDDPATKFDAGFQTVWALTTTNCNAVPSAMAFVMPGTYSTVAAERMTYVENLATGYFAFLNGLPATAKAGDCMCFNAIQCLQQTTTACTIGGANTPVDHSQNSLAACGWADATIWEAGAFTTAFGPHT
ncbi:MAG: hypothetical protein QM831_40840 [Kofleriaceae bacterium]